MPTSEMIVDTGSEGTLFVPLTEVPQTVLSMISEHLESEGSCAFTIEKAWSEEDKAYAVSTGIHDTIPDYDAAQYELSRALKHLETELRGLCRLGFGALTVDVSITSGRKRAINITAGSTERFTVPFEESTA